MACLYLKRVSTEDLDAFSPDLHPLPVPSASKSFEIPKPRRRPSKIQENDMRLGVLDRKLRERTDKEWLVDHNILKQESRQGLNRSLLLSVCMIWKLYRV